MAADADAKCSDEALMTAYGNGDTAAFDELYARHRGAAYRYFLRQLPEDQAKDCFQTLWLKLIRSRSSYQPSAPFVHYLFTLAHNVLMDQHRGQRRLRPVAEEELEDLADADPAREQAEDPAIHLERSELSGLLRKLTDALPLHQREAWLLLQEANLSHNEIASITNTSGEGVKSRLRYARNKLKAGLKAYVRQN